MLHEIVIYATSSIILRFPKILSQGLFLTFIHINHVGLPIACFNRGFYHEKDIKVHKEKVKKERTLINLSEAKALRYLQQVRSFHKSNF
jgi:hypothetical protein